MIHLNNIYAFLNICNISGLVSPGEAAGRAPWAPPPGSATPPPTGRRNTLLYSSDTYCEGGVFMKGSVFFMDIYYNRISGFSHSLL